MSTPPTAASITRGQLSCLYDRLRTALMNRKYYATRLKRVKVCNNVVEGLLIFGTSGTIGSWMVFKTGWGVHAWQVLAGVAAVLAILKPLMKLPTEIERISKLWAGYTELYYSLSLLATEIKITEALPADFDKAFRIHEEARVKLGVQDDPSPSRKLLEKCQDEVNVEIPRSSLWFP